MPLVARVGRGKRAHALFGSSFARCGGVEGPRMWRMHGPLTWLLDDVLMLEGDARAKFIKRLAVMAVLCCWAGFGRALVRENEELRASRVF